MTTNLTQEVDQVLLIQRAPTPVQAEFDSAWEHAPECVKLNKDVEEFWYRKGRLAGRDAEMKSQKEM